MRALTSTVCVSVRACVCGACVLYACTHLYRVCSRKCRYDWWPDEKNGKCYKCHRMCDNCRGPSSEDCIRCMTYKVYRDSELENPLVSTPHYKVYMDS